MCETPFAGAFQLHLNDEDALDEPFANLFAMITTVQSLALGAALPGAAGGESRGGGAPAGLPVSSSGWTSCSGTATVAAARGGGRRSGGG